MTEKIHKIQHLKIKKHQHAPHIVILVPQSKLNLDGMNENMNLSPTHQLHSCCCFSGGKTVLVVLGGFCVTVNRVLQKTSLKLPAINYY